MLANRISSSWVVARLNEITRISSSDSVVVSPANTRSASTKSISWSRRFDRRFSFVPDKSHIRIVYTERRLVKNQPVPHRYRDCSSDFHQGTKIGKYCLSATSPPVVKDCPTPACARARNCAGTRRPEGRYWSTLNGWSRWRPGRCQ